MTVRIHLLVACTVGMLGFAALAAPPCTIGPCNLGYMGGPGGGRFHDVCPDGYYLKGVDTQAGSYVDSITPRCETYRIPKGKTQGHSISLSRHGGNGGSFLPVGCRNRARITQLSVAVAVEDGHLKFIRYIELACKQPDGPFDIFCAGFGGVQCVKEDEDVVFRQSCPDGMVAVGLRGNSGKFLDSIALVCNTPLPEIDIVTRSNVDDAMASSGILTKPLPPDIIATPSFTGVWETTAGGKPYRMTLKQEQGRVTGSYSGTASGTLTGMIDSQSRLIFSWQEPNARGTGIFQLAPGSGAFTGHYSSNDDPNNVTAVWNGTRSKN